MTHCLKLLTITLLSLQLTSFTYAAKLEVKNGKGEIITKAPYLHNQTVIINGKKYRIEKLSKREQTRDFLSTEKIGLFKIDKTPFLSALQKISDEINKNRQREDRIVFKINTTQTYLSSDDDIEKEEDFEDEFADDEFGEGLEGEEENELFPIKRDMFSTKEITKQSKKEPVLAIFSISKTKESEAKEEGYLFLSIEDAKTYQKSINSLHTVKFFSILRKDYKECSLHLSDMAISHVLKYLLQLGNFHNFNIENSGHITILSSGY